MKIVTTIRTNGDGNVEILVENDGEPSNRHEAAGMGIIRHAIDVAFTAIMGSAKESQRLHISAEVSRETAEDLIRAARASFNRPKEPEGGGPG
ncbi:MAG TPA: hypothetical protein VGM54_10105 [Chthoniobacter sp.]|jgi:hypothetical protein